MRLNSKIISMLVVCSAMLMLTGGCGEQSERDVRRTAVVDAVERTLPTVANIGTERMVRVVHDDPTQRARDRLREDLFAEFFGRAPPSEYQPAFSLGSGVVIHPDGLILTNHHVVERASTVYVSVDKHQNLKARTLASDPLSDLALLKVDVDEPLSTITFAADDDLMLGEQIIVLGNPYGLSQTVTVGVLSSKEREATYNGEVIFRDILQTDAAVNPGSSGGALLNVEGELIGVNIAVYREAQNIGFAVPIKRVRQLLNHWLSTEFLLSKTIGLAVEEGASLGEVRVARVLEGSSASLSNVRPGDIVDTVNGKVLAGLLDYRNQLLSAALTDQEVSIGILNEADRRLRTVELGWIEIARPSVEELVEMRFGMVLDIPEDDSEQNFSRGFMINDIVGESVSDRAGLYPGLYLFAVDSIPVANFESLKDFMAGVESGDAVSITVAEFIDEGAMRVVRRLTLSLEAD